MVYYYDVIGLILWANTIKPSMMPVYKDIVDHTKRIRQELKKQTGKLDSMLRTSGVLEHLSSSIREAPVSADCTTSWVPKEAEAHYTAALNRSLELYGYGSNKQHKGKPPIDAVPVAHLMADIPRFYHPKDGWINKPEYTDPDTVYKENNVIIGYDERSSTGIHVRFKIRSPIQNIKQYKDTRMIEKGGVCRTKNKEYLKQIAKKLGIQLREKNNIICICSEIRSKLIRNEITERIKKTNVKWFYFHYEKRPETVQ